MYNRDSLDTVCGALSRIMGIDPPAFAAEPNSSLVEYAEEKLAGRRAGRVLMFNPDAVAQWIYRKYPWFVSDVARIGELELPLRSVMPSVTPVCFGTMYTGAQPAVHGIRKYEKPVIRIDTIFDALIRAGKRPAIVADGECSVGKIFRERDMDYYIFDTLGQIAEKAVELIREDRHDFIAVYHGNYDHWMHKFGPESTEAISELRANNYTFEMLYNAVRKYWSGHDSLIGFAMDHGCHEVDGHSGSHGLDMEEDLNIMHLYTAVPAASGKRPEGA
jgi:predicted AlkP superfamily pyrophosphatase or phosphodiesterase